MATIDNREIIDTIIQNDGIYPGDEDMPVVRIVEYRNDFNGNLAWGVIYRGEDPERYHNSPACHDPREIWPNPVPGSRKSHPNYGN